MPASKHSQYFLRHLDFLQWQPFWCVFALALTLARKALGFFSSVALIASSRSRACAWSLWQSTHLHDSSQKRPAAKQSQ